MAKPFSQGYFYPLIRSIKKKKKPLRKVGCSEIISLRPCELHLLWASAHVESAWMHFPPGEDFFFSLFVLFIPHEQGCILTSVWRQKKWLEFSFTECTQSPACWSNLCISHYTPFRDVSGGAGGMSIGFKVPAALPGQRVDDNH